jgi:hypothetical protein
MTMTATTMNDAAAGGATVTFLVIGIVWAVLVLVAGWKMFEKAGQQGWVAIVPILSTFGLLKIVHRPLWWFILLLIPLVNVVVVVIMMVDLGRAFGRGLGMALLLVLLTPIGFLVLGFGDARYELQPEPLF